MFAYLRITNNNTTTMIKEKQQPYQFFDFFFEDDFVVIFETDESDAIEIPISDFEMWLHKNGHIGEIWIQEWSWSKEDFVDKRATVTIEDLDKTELEELLKQYLHDTQRAA